MVYAFYALVAMAGVKAIWLGQYVFLAIIIGWLLADWFTGFYHLLLDHFSWKGVPVLEQQAIDFQGHHHSPRDIVDESFNKVIEPATYAGCIVLFLSIILTGFWSPLLWSFATFAALSQGFHRWSHMRPSERPQVVTALMKCKILISDKQHLAHHRPPFMKNYSIVSGLTNHLTNRLYLYIMNKVRQSKT